MLRGDVNTLESDLFDRFERLEREECIARCQACHRACVDLASALERGYGIETVRIGTLLLDCAEINLILASSLADCPARLNRPLVVFCAEIDERCAAECARCLEEDAGEICIGACARGARACRHLAEVETLQ